MITSNVLEAVNRLLFANTDLTDIVGSGIYFSRGPVGSTWPQVIYFDVAATSGYIVDYNSATIQISCWSQNAYQALQIRDIVGLAFNRYSGKVNTSKGYVDINISNLLDSSALPEVDPYLFGYQQRYQIWVRGSNLGGI